MFPKNESLRVGGLVRPNLYEWETTMASAFLYVQDRSTCAIYATLHSYLKLFNIVILIWSLIIQPWWPLCFSYSCIIVAAESKRTRVLPVKDFPALSIIFQGEIWAGFIGHFLFSLVFWSRRRRDQLLLPALFLRKLWEFRGETGSHYK